MFERLSELRFQVLAHEASTLWRGVILVTVISPIRMVDIIKVPFQFAIRSMTVD
jgi:hypothetical protein